MINPQLQTFLCVADNGSFSKAAEKLYLSTTAVIKQINGLEKHLDLKLVERTNHGVSLTPAGNVIYRHAKQLLAQSAMAVEEAHALEEAEEHAFRIGTSLLNPCKPFMDLWYPLSRDFPGYRLQIVPFDDDHEGILDEIDNIGSKFDFIVGVCDSKLWMNRAQFQKIGDYNHCIAVPRDHRLASRESLTLDDLEGETLMMVSSGDSVAVDSVRKAVEEHGNIEIENTAHFYDMEVFNRSIKANQPMITLPCWKDVHPGLVTLPMEWDFRIPYGILYPLDADKDILRFIDKVRMSVEG